MSKFAVIQGTSVANIIITEDKEQSEKDLNVILVEVTEENPASIGDAYIDGKIIRAAEPTEEKVDA